MLRTVLAGALAAGALASGGVAQAHDYGQHDGYGYDEGRPAYAAGSYGYAPYRPRSFTLLGARAGLTVLGVDLDASAKLTIGAHGWGGGAAPPPPPPQPVYAREPEYGPPMYEAPMSYGPPPPPPRRWMGYSYSYSPCGC